MKKIKRISIPSENLSATITNDINNRFLVTPSIPIQFDAWAYSFDNELYHVVTHSNSEMVAFDSSAQGNQTIYLRGVKIESGEEILDNTVVEKNVTMTAGSAPVSNSPLSGTWTQIGDDIDGEAASDFSGDSVSMNSDGTIVANGDATGIVRIFQNVNGTWTQVGDNIAGETEYDWFGHAVSLNSDGTIVAIGAWRNDDGGNDSGHVRVYELI